MRRTIVLVAVVLAIVSAYRALAGGAAPGQTIAAPQQDTYGFAGTEDHVRVVSVVSDAEDQDRIVVTLVIDPGYHINANPASSKNLIPTTLTFEGFELTRVIYPKPDRFKPKFTDETLDVYQDTERIIAVFPSGSLKPGTRVRGKLLAQACTDEICLPPAEITFGN